MNGLPNDFDEDHPSIPLWLALPVAVLVLGVAAIRIWEMLA